MPQNDNIKPNWIYFIQKIAVETSVGSVVMGALTPFYYWSNCVFNNQQFGWQDLFSKRALTGATQYALSAGPIYTTSFGSNTLLNYYFNDSPYYNNLTKLAIAATSGMLAGIVSTPFEAIAQNKQLAKLSENQQNIAKTMRLSNGPLVYFRGGG